MFVINPAAQFAAKILYLALKHSSSLARTFSIVAVLCHGLMLNKIVRLMAELSDNIATVAELEILSEEELGERLIDLNIEVSDLVSLKKYGDLFLLLIYMY